MEKRPKRKHLDTYCYNLTQKAKDGKLDAIIGRDKEIGRVVQILSRRTKNNPCLIGEPGVGKTAIAEGLALRIASGNVPARLRTKEIHLLDLTALVAGTQFRGQFESRIKGLVDEVKADGNIILFIDEVHNLVGTGDAEGSMNAANILKPALSRGEIQVIGATTFTEYRKYIEKDSALERRFQPVTVSEPSIQDTVDVLIGIKPYYENYHRVKISNELVKKAVVLSERYITDRFLPDKAIDLVDEACALIKTELDSMPAELDEQRRKILQMQIEEAALKKETDNLSRERLETLQKELAELKDTFNSAKAQWENEKSSVEKLSKLREQIEDMNRQIQKAKNDYDLNRAAELQYGELPKLQQMLEAEEADADFDGSFVYLLGDEEKRVSLADIAAKSMCGNDLSLEASASHSSPKSPPPFMCGMAEVEVDLETGQIDVINYKAAVDCGTVINPALARVQAEGGIVQGIGMTLYEDINYSEKGNSKKFLYAVQDTGQGGEP